MVKRIVIKNFTIGKNDQTGEKEKKEKNKKKLKTFIFQKKHTFIKA
jgi:hypothetical protein